MDFGHFLSVRGRKPAVKSLPHRNGDSRGHLPLISSPLNATEDIVSELADSPDQDKYKSRRPKSFDTISTTSSGNPNIYKSHHEASTIELFYDLFFVANLAYFTAMHQHVDAPSVLNYLKLFTLMWFTWLSTILYDVRFVADSVYNRVCKLVHFGVMAGFVFAGPVFDKYDKAVDQRYYKAFALVLFVSRIVIAVQYIVVMWQSRRFKKALLPLGMTAAVYITTAVLYLITHFSFPSAGPILWYELFVWFVLSIGEGVATMLIAIFFRIISFKYTHLVERMGLLSLILMGEGIIGMVKSVSCVTKGQVTNSGAEIGTVVSAIILIYLIWILYFDAIDHHRFGTIRQQIWALLHYPLHIAILLTVEGNTALIVWNSVVQGFKFVWARQPQPADAPGTNFASSQDFINFINASMVAIDKQFSSSKWSVEYPWRGNLTALANISSTYPFKSAEWNNATAAIVNRMFTSAKLFIVTSHKETMDKIVAIMPTITDDQAALNSIYGVFDIVVLYFYVCAGGMLLILAIMYWFGKLHKTKYEFGEMINRTIMGFVIPVVGVTASLTNKSETGFKFVASNWLIPTVMLGFLIVVVLDNVILTVAHLTDKHRKRSSRWSGGTYVRSPDAEDDDDTTNLVDGSKIRLAERDTVSSTYSRDTAYEPYDTYAAQVSVSDNQRGTSGTEGLSRGTSPHRQQIPMSMVM
ncbi:uncharacterized protein PV09_06731 [Verruconis gallopava]|uniref:Uncharacterized protein n=1 Tax=Verruconis gallopava TaxID=253628 RepID=A0A0D2ARS2_9PEZI|nr:uncharacterized protein PV09_06731 [Verruconis gallopava]KIW01884.1 hypothetical protein PV09_06731 [Verruconis gallopava]